MFSILTFQLLHVTSDIISTSAENTAHIFSNISLNASQSSLQYIQGFNNPTMLIQPQITASFLSVVNLNINCSTIINACQNLFNQTAQIFNVTIFNLTSNTSLFAANITFNNVTFVNLNLQNTIVSSGIVIQNSAFQNTIITNTSFNTSLLNTSFTMLQCQQTGLLFQLPVTNVTLMQINVQIQSTIFANTIINVSIRDSNLAMSELASQSASLSNVTIVTSVINSNSLGSNLTIFGLNMKQCVFKTSQQQFNLIQSAFSISNSTFYQIQMQITSVITSISIFGQINVCTNLLLDTISLNFLTISTPQISLVANSLIGQMQNIQLNNFQLMRTDIFNFSLINSITNGGISNFVLTNTNFSLLAYNIPQTAFINLFNTTVNTIINNSIFQLNWTANIAVPSNRLYFSSVANNFTASTLINCALGGNVNISLNQQQTNSNYVTYAGLAYFSSQSSFNTSYIAVNATLLMFDLVSFAVQNATGTSFSSVQIYMNLTQSASGLSPHIYNVLNVTSSGSSNLQTVIQYFTNASSTSIACTTGVGMIAFKNASIQNCNSAISFSVPQVLPNIVGFQNVAPQVTTLFSNVTFTGSIPYISFMSPCIQQFECTGYGVTGAESYQLCPNCTILYQYSTNPVNTQKSIPETGQIVNQTDFGTIIICPQCFELIATTCVLSLQCQKSKQGYLNLQQEAKINDTTICPQNSPTLIQYCTINGLICIAGRTGPTCENYSMPTPSVNATNSVNSTNSTSSVNSTNSTNSANSSNSTNSTNSSQSVNSTYSVGSTNSSNSVNATNSTGSTNATNSTNSANSIDSTGSTNSSNSVNSVNSTASNNSASSINSQYSINSTNSNFSINSNNSNSSVNSTNSTNSKNSQNSTNSTNSVSSINSTNSVNSTNSDNSTNSINSLYSQYSIGSTNSTNSNNSQYSNNSTNSTNSSYSLLSTYSNYSTNSSNSSFSTNSTNSSNSTSSLNSVNSSNSSNSTDSVNSTNSLNSVSSFNSTQCTSSINSVNSINCTNQDCSVCPVCKTCPINQSSNEYIGYAYALIPIGIILIIIGVVLVRYCILHQKNTQKLNDLTKQQEQNKPKSPVIQEKNKINSKRETSMSKLKVEEIRSKLMDPRTTSQLHAIQIRPPRPEMKSQLEQADYLKQQIGKKMNGKIKSKKEPSRSDLQDTNVQDTVVHMEPIEKKDTIMSKASSSNLNADDIPRQDPIKAAINIEALKPKRIRRDEDSSSDKFDENDDSKWKLMENKMTVKNDEVKHIYTGEEINADQNLVGVLNRNQKKSDRRMPKKE